MGALEDFISKPPLSELKTVTLVITIHDTKTRVDENLPVYGNCRALLEESGFEVVSCEQAAESLDIPVVAIHIDYRTPQDGVAGLFFVQLSLYELAILLRPNDDDPVWTRTWVQHRSGILVDEAIGLPAEAATLINSFINKVAEVNKDIKPLRAKRSFTETRYTIPISLSMN